jgi:hypothetical protein
MLAVGHNDQYRRMCPVLGLSSGTGWLVAAGHRG